jgi:hypothetical protein
MTPDLEAKLDVMLGADLVLAQRNMIQNLGNGVYEVFGRWQLQPGAGRIEVWVRGNRLCSFADLRTAVGWCTAEKYHQRELGAEICRLDQDLTRLRDQDQVRKATALKLRDPDRRAVALIKSAEVHRRHRITNERLRECIRQAKYFQIKGFNDEIARTRRPAPHKTGRDGARKPRRKTH